MPSPSFLTAKDTGRMAPLRLAAFAQQGNPLRMLPAVWRRFVADVRARGVLSPIIVFVRPGREPYVDEGNHRLQAAIEARLRSVPVEIYYYGGAEIERPSA